MCTSTSTRGCMPMVRPRLRRGGRRTSTRRRTSYSAAKRTLCRPGTDRTCRARSPCSITRSKKPASFASPVPIAPLNGGHARLIRARRVLAHAMTSQTTRATCRWRSVCPCARVRLSYGTCASSTARRPTSRHRASRRGRALCNSSRYARRGSTTRSRPSDGACSFGSCIRPTSSRSRVTRCSEPWPASQTAEGGAYSGSWACRHRCVRRHIDIIQ
mmetsp:Transcript_52305/g.120263  ORF Transcript_52305/g.120263 Transcript_52305/m.120263 type:complete len:216 (+) Transcript_52305:422-1069(+)